MPCTNGAYVVWKMTHSRFASGGIYLYEVATGKGKEIAAAVDGKSGYDMPTIGDDSVVFMSGTGEGVLLYHLQDGTTETLATNGGRTYIAGHYVAWVGDTVTEKQDWYLLWADLSQPNTSDAAPNPLPGTPPAPPVEPSPASPAPAASPSRTPGPAADLSGWPTYEDAQQGYRLRYPAGATITTDQSGDTTLKTLWTARSWCTIMVCWIHVVLYSSRRKGVDDALTSVP